MDWEDWNLFLTLFSVEQTQPFVEELGLPLRPGQFPRLTRLARACLEAEKFPSTLTPAGHASSPGFIEAWRAWRAAGGVLGEAELRAIHARLGRDWDAYLPHTFGLLRHQIGDATADALLAWCWRHCFPSDHRRYAWPRLLRDFATQGAGRRADAPAPLTGAEREAVGRFLRRYRRGQEALELRFWYLHEEAEARPPGLWELVLLTFGADGPTTRRFWLDSLCACLSLRDLRRAWGELRRDLGGGRMAELTAWIRLNPPVGANFGEREPDEEGSARLDWEGD